MSASQAIKLRPFILEDALTVALLVGDEAVSQWTSSIPHPYYEQDAIDWIKHSQSDSARTPFAVEVDGRLAGCVSFWPYEGGSVEVGYWVGREFWGRGVCTQALRMLLVAKCFPSDTDVYAKVMAGNEASIRVLEKCGFEYFDDGVIRKNGKGTAAKFYVRRC